MNKPAMKPFILSKKSFKYTKSKQKIRLPTDLILSVLCYASQTLSEILKMATLNKEIRSKLMSNPDTIIRRTPTKLLQIVQPKLDQLVLSKTLTVQKVLSEIRLKAFEKCNQKLNVLSKLLAVNSSKENSVNSIIAKLDLKIEVSVNGNQPNQTKQFSKIDNFASIVFLVFEIEQLVKEGTVEVAVHVVCNYGKFAIAELPKTKVSELIKAMKYLKVYGYKTVDNLLFMPGFSTASEVSNLSGRGVGMDVVKKSIQALGGRVSIVSVPGQGSSFIISLPLTLAILDGMVVRIAGQTTIIPLTDIVETLKPKPEDIHDFSTEGQVVFIRGAFVPLVDVGATLGYRAPLTKVDNQIVVLTQTEDSALSALLVDEIFDQRQVVIKGLEENYGSVPGIAAATILGDGRIALILDVDRIVSRKSMTADLSEAA